MRKKENYDSLLITSIAGGEVDQNKHVYSTPAGGPLNWTSVERPCSGFSFPFHTAPMSSLDCTSPFMKGPKRKRLAKVVFVSLHRRLC